MSKNVGIVGCIAFICLFAAPTINGLIKGEQLTKDSRSGIYKDQSVEVEVVDINMSNNGFKFCTFYVKTMSKKMIGECNDTSNKTNFVVGGKYLVSKLQLSNDGNIIINRAELISTGSKVKVVRLFTKARTLLAELDNGDVVGGANLKEGDYVYR